MTRSLAITAAPREDAGAPYPSVLLVGVNARYSYPAYGARCLAAALEGAGMATRVMEVEPDCEPAQLLDRVLSLRPRLVGFSVMIWNVTLVRETLRLARLVAPHLPCVLGGPELGDETSARTWLDLADAVVLGEAEKCFPDLVRRFLAGEAPRGVFVADDPDPALIVPPDTVYPDADLTHRTVFVESSRGCPLRCGYCTSRGSRFRTIPFPLLESHWNRLIARGARAFRFLDRSFNANGDHGLRVLDFFLAKPDPGLRLHLEFLPVMPPPAWRERLQAFSPGKLHIEVGIQSLDPGVLRQTGRNADVAAILDALAWLCRESGAQVHADLIAGLPGETSESLADAFNRVAAVRPHALQLNLLKGLPGTDFRNRAAELGLTFSPMPPYMIIDHSNFSFVELMRLQRAAYCWDRLYNRADEAKAAWLQATNDTPFETILALADRVVAAEGRVHALPRERLERHLDHVLKEQDSGFSRPQRRVPEQRYGGERRAPPVPRETG